MKCPDGHRWWECKHTELAHPLLGTVMMMVGGFFAGLGIVEVLFR
jgi:hypothetical protein